MIIRTIVTIFLLLYTGCLCHPVHISQPAPKNISSVKESNEKKGTIRISGPWHSDSALDRNIDLGEDSYVKKIISSNEGINFNKDMAEAGEMFDVNGIEDFYDKNAVVTYEVNGHEIPVHLKQKYTPQTKVMFPEYNRDSPPTLAAMTKSPSPQMDKKCRKSFPCVETPKRGAALLSGTRRGVQSPLSHHQSPLETLSRNIQKSTTDADLQEHHEEEMTSEKKAYSSGRKSDELNGQSEEYNRRNDETSFANRKTMQHLPQRNIEVDKEGDKLIPEQIQKFKEQGRPFVMNTASIDYNPKEDDEDEEKDNNLANITPDFKLNDDVSINDKERGKISKFHRKMEYDNRDNDAKEKAYVSDDTPHRAPQEEQNTHIDDVNAETKSNHNHDEHSIHATRHHKYTYESDNPLHRAPGEDKKENVDDLNIETKVNDNNDEEDRSATLEEETHKTHAKDVNAETKSNDKNDENRLRPTRHHKNVYEIDDSPHKAPEEDHKENVNDVNATSKSNDNNDENGDKGTRHDKNTYVDDDLSHRATEANARKANTGEVNPETKLNDNRDENGKSGTYLQKNAYPSDDASHQVSEETHKTNIDDFNPKTKSNGNRDEDDRSSTHHQRNAYVSNDSHHRASEGADKVNVNHLNPETESNDKNYENDRTATHHQKSAYMSDESPHRAPEETRKANADDLNSETKSNDNNDSNGSSGTYHQKNAHVSDESPHPTPGAHRANNEDLNPDTKSNDNNDENGKNGAHDEKHHRDKEYMQPDADTRDKYKNNVESTNNQMNQNKEIRQSSKSEQATEQHESDRGVGGLEKDKQKSTQSHDMLLKNKADGVEDKKVDNNEEYIPNKATTGAPLHQELQELKQNITPEKDVRNEDASPTNGREKARQLLEGLSNEKGGSDQKASTPAHREETAYHDHHDEHKNEHDDHEHHQNVDQHDDHANHYENQDNHHEDHHDHHEDHHDAHDNHQNQQEDHHDAHDNHENQLEDHHEHHDDHHGHLDDHNFHDAPNKVNQKSDGTDATNRFSDEHYKSLGGGGFSKSTTRKDGTISSRQEIGTERERTFTPKTQHAETAEYPDYNEVKDAAVFETNLFRKSYRGNQLNWSDRLSDKAQQVAEKIGKTFINDNGKQLDEYKRPGENVALVKLDAANVGKDAVDTWSKESKDYDFKSPLITKKNSDFVQLAWKNQKEFGMGVSKSKAGNGWVVVSLYDSPYVDRYQELTSNVQPDKAVEDPYGDISG